MSQPDFSIADHGSIVLLTPLTNACAQWIAENVEVGQTWGGAIVVEPRYVEDLVDGLLINGYSQ